MKYILLLIVFSSYFYAKEIKASYIINTKAIITDFIISNNKIFISNKNGSIEIFDLKKEKITDEIVLPLLKTKKQKIIYSRIINIDSFKNKLLIVSSSLRGFTDVWIYENYKLKKIISAQKKLSIKEARFLDENNIILGTISHEVISYNLNESYTQYTKHLEQSSLSDITLSKDKKTLISSSESGQVTLINTKNGKIIKKFSSLNVDNIYNIDFKNNTIITAGQDRRVGVYLNNGEEYYIQTNFMVYAASLSPSAKLGAYSKGEESDIEVFEIKSEKSLYTLKGHYAKISKINFINEKELFSSGNGNKLFYWILK